MISDLGGVIEVIIVIFGFLFFPISYQSFVLKFAKTLFKARTSDESLFKTKKDPYEFIKKKPKEGKIRGEINKHKIISLKLVDKLLLFASNRGINPPASCWRKRRQL